MGSEAKSRQILETETQPEPSFVRIGKLATNKRASHCEEGNAVFTGRFGSCKYYDMDERIDTALDLVEAKLKIRPK